MSRNLDEWRRAVALSFAQLATPALAVRATGNSLAAQNDEPEPSSAEDVHLAEVSEVERQRIAADLAEDHGKSARRHAASDRAALEAQVMSLDAMRRAGWL